MKYVLQAVVKTKAWIVIILDLLVNSAFLILNTKILAWIGIAVSDFNKSFYYINLIIVGCIINVIFSGLSGFTTLYRPMINTQMLNMYSDKICGADMDLFSKYSPGVISNTGGKIWQIVQSIEFFIRMIRYAIEIIINMVAIIFISKFQSIPVFVCFFVSGIAFAFIRKKWNELDRKMDSIRRERDVEQDEITNGFLEARSFSGTIESHKQKMHELNNKMFNLAKRRRYYSASLESFITLGNALCTVIVLLYAALAYKNGISVMSATTFTLVVYVWRMGDPYISLILQMSTVSELKAALPKFNEIMGYQNKMVDGNISLASFDNSIEIKDVSFSYDESSSVLSNINMMIPKGAKVGICGASGGGKSTFLKLIPRFYDVSSGEIKIDGINIKKIKISSLRSHIGIVHQQAYIFDGTIFDNIAYGKRPNKVSEHEVIEACKKANIYDYIKTLPDGLYTKVGPRGLKLSGGQKQRISIARVFLVDPDIIILDEATSALDNETELAIQDALSAFKGKTMITVAHRLSTIQDSDAIYVIDNHQIAEQGTHKQLISLKGLYYKMYNTKEIF